MKTKRETDLFDEKDKLKSSSIFDEKDNAYITETAGFIPLEVKLKQFQENGLIAQFSESEFTSNDLRQIYLNPDFDISPEDDLEDIQEKMEARQQFINELQKKKLESNEPNETAGTSEHENKIQPKNEEIEAE